MTTAMWLLHAFFVCGCFWFRLRPAASTEALFHFWALPMVHGLHWAVLAQVCLYGRSKASLWDRWGSSMGDYMLLAQLPDFVLLFVPAVAISVYAWWESEFVALSFYDLHSQLLPEHMWLNWAFHLFSPALPLALCFLANAPMLHFCAYAPMLRYFGTVRWDSEQWTVWLTPLRFQSRNAA
ncbi:hypothetical protein T492DRAFT_893921 [Pavlovales sp. CCMP2436]|nr:hypothetical protein T492DRAFT_893921 [Pavlovales sp. CCMP2436]